MLKCRVQHDSFQILISLLLIIGIIISYLPQHIRIIYKKSSYGFSPYFLLLGLLGCFFTFCNGMIYQYFVVECCFSQTLKDCLVNLLGLLQIFSQFLMFLLLYILVIVYYPETNKYICIHDTSGNLLVPRVTTYSREWRLSLKILFALIFIISGVMLITALLVLILGPENKTVRLWGQLLGYFAMGCSLCQYVPQLLKTHHSKRIGSLSILTMMIQTPGTFLLVYSQISQPHSHYTTWIGYLTTAFLQGSLLIMCLYYRRKEKKAIEIIPADQNPLISK